MNQRKAGGCQLMPLKTLRSWAQHNTHVFMLYSAAHVILENKLMVTCLTLNDLYHFLDYIT